MFGRKIYKHATRGENPIRLLSFTLVHHFKAYEFRNWRAFEFFNSR